MPEEMARAVKVATPAVLLSGLATGYMCSSVVCLMFILFLFCRFSSDVPASQTCPMFGSFFQRDLGGNQPQDSTDRRTITQASNVNLYQQSEMEEGATTGGLGPKLTKTTWENFLERMLFLMHRRGTMGCCEGHGVWLIFPQVKSQRPGCPSWSFPCCRSIRGQDAHFDNNLFLQRSSGGIFGISIQPCSWSNCGASVIRSSSSAPWASSSSSSSSSVIFVSSAFLFNL